MNALAALVWCGIVAARPVAMPCPMGGHGAAHQAVQGGVSTAAHVMHGQQADMAHEGMGTPDAAPAVPGNPDNPRHTCDCLAHCCASVAALPGVVAPLVAIVEAAAEPSNPQAQTSYVSVRGDFVLPFAIAPPVSART
ncbi:MAG: hypothetical protein IPP90_20565 [Gemmatimonadaceae bacterium]|nr:hypothetical protein [Gemmatimonadaceae bacterium]